MNDKSVFKEEKGFANDVEQQLTGGCFMVPATATALIVLGFALNIYF